MLSPKLRRRLLKSRDQFPGCIIWHPAPVLKYKKLSQAKENFFYLRCDPWRAGRGQEFGPVGRQLFIPGVWYITYISSSLTNPKRAGRWYLGDWHIRKEQQIEMSENNAIFYVLHAQQIESNLFAQKVFTIWNVSHNLDQLVDDLKVVLKYNQLLIL